MEDACQKYRFKRVMEKSGLTYEGTARHEVLKWNNYEDVCKYGIIRSEWENRKSKYVVKY